MATSFGKLCVHGRLLLVDIDERAVDNNDGLQYFSVEGQLEYVGFCDDFGTMSLGTLYQFCTVVDNKLERGTAPVGMLTKNDPKSLTNAVFLLGAYLIVRFDLTLSETVSRFSGIRSRICSYRDVSPGEQNFHLHVEDCWDGLWRAKQLLSLIHI